MAPLRIAIIGAGPAGCTLARLLFISPQSTSFEITIYEGEASLDARAQGSTLDLHTETGLAVMKRARLYDEFLKHARFDGEAIKITDRNLRRYVDANGGKSDGSKSRGRPEIDRARLRELLVASIPEDMIKWNHRLRSATQSPTGQVTLHFDHTTVSDIDLVVGADGAWSKVRPLVSTAQPFFSGVSGAVTSIKDPSTTHPDIYTLVNRGSVFCYGDHMSLMMQQLGDGSINVSTWSVASNKSLPAHRKDPSIEDSEKLRAQVLTKYDYWHPLLQKALRVADGAYTPMDLHMLPVGHSWTHVPGVTIIGDAAHLMTPFAGVGLNIALQDAMLLADAIIRTITITSTTLSKEIESFEKDMVLRATAAQQLTYDSMQMMYFEDGTPDSVIERWICGHAKKALPWFAAPLMYPLVYAYFALFRLLGWGMDKGVEDGVKV